MPMQRNKVTTVTFREMKERGERITMLTAYDCPTARLVDEAGIDAILVGDSVANVILGYKDTLAVTMEEMLHHTRAVARGVKRALVVGDMPFMSYQASVEEAVRNAGRFLKEAGAEAVKVEGGREVLDKVEAMIQAGIPVMGHLGLTPQWVHRLGGYKVQGRKQAAARAILEDAKKLEGVGVFGIVLECVPWQLAKLITERVRVPTIGCGAGPYCDGQVLVLHDLLGLSQLSPRFVKRYADLATLVRGALRRYVGEVRAGKFPTLDHSYEMDEAEFRKLKKSVGGGRESSV